MADVAMTVDGDRAEVQALLDAVTIGPDNRPALLVAERRPDGLLRIASYASETDPASGEVRPYRDSTPIHGDALDRNNVLWHIALHVARRLTNAALMHLRHDGEILHDTEVDGPPYVYLPPRPADYAADPDRSEMLARRRSRQALGYPSHDDRDDPELDALDGNLAGVEVRWPGSTVSGLWGERWADVVQPNGPGGLRYGRPSRAGDLYIASESGRMNTDTGRPFGKDDQGRIVHFHPCTPFAGDPYDRDAVLAAAARHVAFFGCHEALEWATVDGRRLYDPHVSGEPEVRLPGL